MALSGFAGPPRRHRQTDGRYPAAEWMAWVGRGPDNCHILPGPVGNRGVFLEAPQISRRTKRRYCQTAVAVRRPLKKSGLGLEAIVSERPVGLGHPVSIVPLLDGRTFVLSSQQQLSREFLFHGVFRPAL